MAQLEQERAAALARAGLREWWATLGRSLEGAQVFERDGLLCTAISPDPNAAFFNSINYLDEQELIQQLDQVEPLLTEAGVTARCIRGPRQHTQLGDELKLRGYAEVNLPVAMAASLDRYGRSVQRGFDVELVEPGEVFTLNDSIYPFANGVFGRTAGNVQAANLRAYGVRGPDRQLVSGLLAFDATDAFRIELVATLPQWRGEGTATAVHARALVDARQRGFGFATLHASAMGQPIYERMGYENVENWVRWEHKQNA